MRPIANLTTAFLFSILAGSTAAAQCGCGAAGCALPIDPLTAGADHSCESHSNHDHSNEILDGINLSSSVFTGGSLANSSLVGADLTSALMSLVDATGVNLSGADLDDARFDQSLLSGANLIDADATNAYLKQSDFSGANLNDADLSGAVLELALLPGAMLNRVDLSNSFLIGADLTGADLMGADLSFAYLFGANLDQADFTGAKLFGAILASTAGQAFYDACTDFSGTTFDPVAAGWIFIPSSEPLVGCGQEISLSQGGAQVFALDAGPAHAGESYLVLGSVTGTSPGTPITPAGLMLPLNVDAYTYFTMEFANSTTLPSSYAQFDGAGQAASAFTLPPGMSPTLIGVTAHHAFVGLTASPSLSFTFVSNPVPVRLVP